MRLVAFLGTAILLSNGCYDSSFGERSRVAAPQPVTATIGELRDAFAGTTFTITSNIVVSGRVTTSDRSGNFYRTFCVEHDGAGIEVMAGIDHLHNDYPEGCTVTLHLRGFALGTSRGMLQTGRMPAVGSGFATDYIGSAAGLDAVVTRNTTSVEPLRPALHRISTLTTDICGTLISIDKLYYAPEELSPATWAGYKRFRDEAGAELFTYVRAYADFAEAEVPDGPCTLTGILQHDQTNDGRYILKLRDENDCTH